MVPKFVWDCGVEEGDGCWAGGWPAAQSAVCVSTSKTASANQAALATEVKWAAVPARTLRNSGWRSMKLNGFDEAQNGTRCSQGQSLMTGEPIILCGKPLKGNR